MRSGVSAIRWPALLPDRGARLAALLLQLEQSQWWDEQKLKDAQCEQLAALVQHALDTVPHYRQSGTNRVTPATVSAVLQALPVLKRADIQRAANQLHSTACPQAHGKVTAVQTSGSTGQPVELLSTAVTRHFFQALTLREHLWHRRNLKTKLVSIRPDRERKLSGRTASNWGAPTAWLFDTGPSAFLHSSEPLSRQMDWLLEQQPGYLLSMPSNLKALAEGLQERNTPPHSLIGVRTYGETLQPTVREMLTQQWQVPVVDMYSSVEIGYIALQCPLHQHYHLQSEALYTEVVDDDGKPCQPGEVGRLLITPLHNFASPLLRYEIGDYVEVGEPCPCGRGLPVINRVLGRERNMITLPDGSRHWPSFPEHDWMDVAPIRQLQLAQTGLDKIEVRTVTEQPLTAEQQRQLADVFSAALGHAFTFEFTAHQSLARGRNLKFEDFVSELESG